MTIEDKGGGIPPVILPDSKGPEPRASAWRWSLHLAILVAYPLVIGALGLMADGKSGQPALSSTVRGVLAISLTELCLFGVVFGIAWWASKASFRDLYLAERFRWRMIPIGAAYSVGLRIGIAIAAALIAGALVAARVLSTDQLRDFVMANRPEVEALVDVDSLKNSALYMILNVTLVSFVVAGFREELWRAGVLAGLRALWPSRFSSVGGQLLGISIAAVIFGLGHLVQGVLAAFLTGVLGFLLGAIMVFHKSVWPAVLAHGFFNATTFVVLPWAVDFLPEALLINLL